jgi:hypothetical protein
MALKCINGPSLPVDKPDIKIDVSPIHFAKNVLHVSTFSKFKPFNIAFNSGIPDPAAY